jgi:hypothetical protein
MQTKQRLTILVKAPTARGTFDGEIDANPKNGDKDNERISSWVNLPGTFPLVYQHTIGDPGAIVGKIDVRLIAGGRLFVSGRLDLKGNPMAVAVHERMMLPASDEMALSELSVGFEFDSTKVTKDSNGVDAIHDSKLIEVSVVHRGAQTTTVSNVKRGARNSHADQAKLQAAHDALVEAGAVCSLTDALGKRGTPGELRSEIESDHQGYASEVIRARDRLIELRELHDAEASAGHPGLAARDVGYCTVCGIIAQVLKALDSSSPIDHEQLHSQLDQAFTIVEVDLAGKDIETRMRLTRLEHSLTLEGKVKDLARTTRVEQGLRDLERELKEVEARRKAINSQTRREVFGPPKRVVTTRTLDEVKA